MLSELIGQVLAFQPAYSSKNTDPMRERGIVIRERIPGELAAIRHELAYLVGIEPAELLIEGSDGTGLKARVPWVRFASKSLSPAATFGWYAVFLHREDGAGVYLALAHGSAQFREGALISRSDEELGALVAWARTAIGAEIAKNSRLTRKVDLASGAALPLAYEKSCVAAFYYPKAEIPSDLALRADMLFMAELLGGLYEAERQGKTPLSMNPEVSAAEEAARRIAKPLSGRGQGILLSPQERKAIEMRAMEMASGYLRSAGFAVKDTSATESFDFLATKGSEAIKVEVKGTTGLLSEILLTKNEVALHKECFPNNALIVVHSIQLTKGSPPSAGGGKLEAWLPWSIDPDRLTALSFSYVLTSS